MVTTKGTGQFYQCVSMHINVTSLRLFCMDCLKGGPILRTTPENMYWKQDIKKRVVFSEFLILDFCVSSCGGTNLAFVSKNMYPQDI